MPRVTTRSVARRTNQRRSTWRRLAVGALSSVARHGAYTLGRYTGNAIRNYAGNAIRNWQNHRNIATGRSRPAQAPPSSGNGGHRSRFTDMNVDDLTNDRFSLVINKRRLRRASRAKIKFQETFQAIVTNSEGAAGATELRYHFHQDSFTFQNTARNSKTGQATPYFDMIMNAKTTGNAAGPVGTAAQSIAQSLNIESGRCELTFGNLENSSCTVWIYFFLCKRSTTLSPYESWVDDLSDRGYGLTTDVPTVTTDTTWGAGSVTQSFLGSFPNTPNVKRNWKLLKVRKFNLDGGQSHTINYYLKMNKRVDKDYVDPTQTNTPKFIAGLTIAPLVICRGSMVGINDTGASTTASEVTFSPCKLGVVGIRKYTFSTLPEPPTYPLELANYGIVAGTSHVYGPKIINDEDALADLVKVQVS